MKSLMLVTILTLTIKSLKPRNKKVNQKKN